MSIKWRCQPLRLLFATRWRRPPARPENPAGTPGACADGDAGGGVPANASRRWSNPALWWRHRRPTRKSTEVKTETDGIVQEVRFQEGQIIERGDLLVKLDDTKLRAELADGGGAAQVVGGQFRTGKQLFDDRLISQQEFDQAASTFEVSQATLTLRRRLLDDSMVHAPFRGRTGARNVSPGQVITRNTVITWLVDLDPMKVEMNVPERYLGETRIGQRIQFDVTAYPGRLFEGEIYFIAPRLDLATRTALVKRGSRIRTAC